MIFLSRILVTVLVHFLMTKVLSAANVHILEVPLPLMQPHVLHKMSILPGTQHVLLRLSHP